MCDVTKFLSEKAGAKPNHSTTNVYMQRSDITLVGHNMVKNITSKSMTEIRHNLSNAPGSIPSDGPCSGAHPSPRDLTGELQCLRTPKHWPVFRHNSYYCTCFLEVSEVGTHKGASSPLGDATNAATKNTTWQDHKYMKPQREHRLARV